MSAINTLNQINKATENTDEFTRSSIGRAISYMALSNALSSAIKLLPPLPAEGKGVDAASEYHSALAEARQNIHDQCGPLIGFASLAADMFGAQTDGSLEFALTNAQQQPKRENFDAEWRQLAAQGKATVPRHAYVDTEFALATKRYEHALADGQCALDILLGIDDSVSDTNLPDWIAESVYDKAVQKLYARIEQIDTRLMRARGNFRKTLEADRSLINDALTKLGAEPQEITYYTDTPVAPAAPQVDAQQAFMQMFQQAFTQMFQQMQPPAEPFVAPASIKPRDAIHTGQPH